MTAGSSRIEGGAGFNLPGTGKAPKISIITAALNSAATIEAAIQSVAEQTLLEKEFIIIDGGSTDGTIDILRRYDDRITYWASEPDQGIYPALNKGVESSSGKWLYFLGADDVLHDAGVLERVLSQDTGTKMIYGNVRYGDKGNIYDGRFSKYKLMFKNICQQAVFYRRDVFDGRRFDTKYPLYADWHLNIMLFSEKETNPRYVPETVARYSANGKSTGSFDYVFLDERKKIIKQFLGEYWLSLFRARMLFGRWLKI